MPKDIILIRHGETEANAADVWQGHGDSPLSDTGREQVDRLGERLRGWSFDVAVSSDLGRAVATAAAVSDSFEALSRWREANIGTWEGLTREQIAESHADGLTALARREDVRMGGGESYAEFTARVQAALDALLDRLDDGQRAAVVAHGGVIGSIIRNVLGIDGRRPRAVVRLGNTSLTTIRVFPDGERQVVSYNDRSHLNGAASGRAELWLVRHGQSEANLGDRWQGTTDSPLTPEGRRQAQRLAEWGLPVDAVYTSPSTRARSTAAPIAASRGVEAITRPDISEFHFGDWEDLTTEEIIASRPDEWQRLMEGGEDLPRGSTGETFAQVAERMQAAVTDVHSRHGDAPVGVVTHGSATRALVASVLGLDFAHHRRLALPDNTAVSRVKVRNPRMVLDSYNLTPHLEG